ISPIAVPEGSWAFDDGHSFDAGMYFDANQVANPGFESNTTGWSNFASGSPTGTRTRVNTQAKDGTWSYQFIKTAGAAADKYGANTTFAATAGNTYSVEDWFKVTAISGDLMQTRMQVIGNAGAGGASVSVTDTLTGTSGWHKMLTSFVCSTDATM